jgi:hypothetical protein
VDSVDRIKTASDMGVPSRTQTVSWALCPEKRPQGLWTEWEYLSTGLSTEKALFSSNPHLGESQSRLPHMGGMRNVKFQPKADLSTVNAIYPQIIASYPQVEPPKDGYGGFPCPLDVGVALSD